MYKFNFIRLFIIALVAAFAFSSFAPINIESSKNSEREISKKERKEQKLAKRQAKVKKFLESKYGKKLVQKFKQRQERVKQKLESKIKKAEIEGKYKKKERLEKRLKAQANLVKLGLWLMIGGVLALVVGLAVAAGSATGGDAGGFGFGAILYILGGIAFWVGVILLIIGLIQK